jgi:hypothetical protein
MKISCASSWRSKGDDFAMRCAHFIERVKHWYVYDIKPNRCLIAFALWIIIGSWYWQIENDMSIAIIALGCIGLVYVWTFYVSTFGVNEGRDPTLPEDDSLSIKDQLLRFEYKKKVKKAHIRACMAVILVVQMFLAQKKHDDIVFDACMAENSDIKPKSERVDFCTPEPMPDN